MFSSNTLPASCWIGISLKLHSGRFTVQYNTPVTSWQIVPPALNFGLSKNCWKIFSLSKKLSSRIAEFKAKNSYLKFWAPIIFFVDNLGCLLEIWQLRASTFNSWRRCNTLFNIFAMKRILSKLYKSGPQNITSLFATDLLQVQL